MNMLNDNTSSRQSSPPPAHDYNKFNFLQHVQNLLTLIHSDADIATVSQEAAQLRLAFQEARSEADKMVGSNLGVKEQEIVIAKLTEQVNMKRRFVKELKEMDIVESLNGGSRARNDSMDIDTKVEET